jgi:hypothetical protein
MNKDHKKITIQLFIANLQAEEQQGQFRTELRNITDSRKSKNTQIEAHMKQI